MVRTGIAVRLSFSAAILLTGRLAPAAGQVLNERSVSLQMARAIADAARAACTQAGFDVTVGVVDRSGTLKVLLRADSASPHNADLARRKAYTARTFRITSFEFQARSGSGQPLAPQRNLTDVIALGGGVPVLIGSDAIGGVGVSGTPSQEQDEACAAAGVATIADTLH